MRTRACLATLLLAAGLAFTSHSADADDKDAVTETARRRFQEGVKYFDQKKYEEARAAFLQAYALKHHPAVLLNLAQSEIRSGHPLEASRHFATFLRESSSASPAERADAEKGLATARTRLARIHVAAPSGAEVTVDGEPVGQAPLTEPIDVMPGAHTVEGRLGGRTASTTVTVPMGKAVNVPLNLESTSTSVPPPPPATESAPSPPPMPAPSPPPSETQERPAEPPKESPAPPPAPVETATISTGGREPFFTWLGHNGVGIAGVAATLIGAGVGTGFAIAAERASQNADSVALQIQNEALNIMTTSAGLCVNPAAKVNNESNLSTSHTNVTDAQRKDEIQRLESACALLTNDLDLRKRDRTYATVGFVVAGVGLTATIAAYLLTSNKSGSSARRSATSFEALVLPAIGPAQSGLTVVGRF